MHFCQLYGRHKAITDLCKAFQAQSSLTWRVDTNSASWSTSRIWGPTTRSSLSFASLILGNSMHRYWKALSSLSSALLKVFITPNLIWRGGRTFWGDTRGSNLHCTYLRCRTRSISLHSALSAKTHNHDTTYLFFCTQVQTCLKSIDLWDDPESTAGLQLLEYALAAARRGMGPRSVKFSVGVSWNHH